MITIVDKLEEAEYVTHAGNFHADDVLGAVFLEKLHDNIKLIRLKTHDPFILENRDMLTLSSMDGEKFL